MTYLLRETITPIAFNLLHESSHRKVQELRDDESPRERSTRKELR